MIGKVLDGRYRILSSLGEGGMGQVFLAEHTVLGKKVAVKVLHAQYSRHEEVVKRFQQEAIAASRIGQENIVDVTDFGRTAEGSLYFVMEQLDGVSLAQLIRSEGPIDPLRLLPILAQVCKALGAAHACGIVHRDLKPENIILLQREDRPDFVKVLDFGISKVASGDTSSGERLTRAGMIMGTPEYMAPEQAAGTVVDHRADIYALGVVAYELLTGTLPFIADNPLSVLLKHQTEQPEPMRTRRPELELSVDLEAIVMRALEKDPAQRQHSMSEVLRELAGCMERRGMRPLTFSLPPHERAEVITPGGGVPPPVPVSLLPGDPNRPTRELAQPPTRDLPAPLEVSEAALMAESNGQPPPEPRAASSRAPLLAGIGVGAVLVLGALGYFAIDEKKPLPSEGAEATVHEPKTPAVQTEPEPEPEPGDSAASTEPAAGDVIPASVTAIQTVTLDSVPSGAVVYEGTLRLGVTPLELRLKAGSAATYRLALDGYQPATRTVESGDREVKVELVRKSRRTRRVRTGLKENPYEDLKANPF